MVLIVPESNEEKETKGQDKKEAENEFEGGLVKHTK